MVPQRLPDPRKDRVAQRLHVLRIPPHKIHHARPESLQPAEALQKNHDRAADRARKAVGAQREEGEAIEVTTHYLFR